MFKTKRLILSRISRSLYMEVIWIGYFVFVYLVVINILFLRHTNDGRLCHTKKPSHDHNPTYIRNTTKAPIFTHKSICANLFDDQKSAQHEAMVLQKAYPYYQKVESLARDLSEGCGNFVKSREYIMEPLSKEEAEFPIAYSILMYKDSTQVERLLRAIYRPQNFYCIHVDVKTDYGAIQTITSIAECFPNVFLSSKFLDVTWGSDTVLEADLTCMKDLLKFSSKWKYFINLTGQEFPLKTNLDIVKILKASNGANHVECVSRKKWKMLFASRTQYKYIVDGKRENTLSQKKEPFPHNLTITKGSVHVVVSREFVNFVLYNSIAKEFREWIRDTDVPDETFFPTMYINPQIGVPGSFAGNISDELYPFPPRYKIWKVRPSEEKCRSNFFPHGVCIMSIWDLPSLASSKKMFVNKLESSFHPLAYDCLEELIHKRTREDVSGTRNFDASFVKEYDFVKNAQNMIGSNQ